MRDEAVLGEHPSCVGEGALGGAVAVDVLGGGTVGGVVQPEAAQG